MPRQFGYWTATLVTVASMVGVGILTTSGYILRDTESPSTLFLLWTVGGVLSLMGALTFAELATRLPHAGGDYVFVRAAYGEGIGFTYGWATLLLGFAGPTAVISHALAVYFLLPLRVHWIGSGGAWGDWVTPATATFVIAMLTIGHCRGQQASAWMQNATTTLKLVLLVAFAVAGLAWGSGDATHFTTGRPLSDQGLVAIGALVYVFYGYSGWNASAYLAGEVAKPTTTLPRAILSGCLMVTLLYLAINATYVFALPPDALRQADPREIEAIAETAARRLFGPAISEPLSILIGLTILASVSSYLLTGSRICYAMAVDGVFPRYAARVRANRGTPAAATLTLGIASILLLWGSFVISGAADAFASLLNFTSVGLVLLTSLAVSSLFILRRRDPLPAGFSTPLYPLPPLLFLLVTGGLMLVAIRQSPATSLWGAAAVVSGAPLYWIAKNWRLRSGDRSTL
ncbi:MAG: amino acid permease [Planctomycetaceae bacterium]|nr:amino acid permease [Planctomycetaceae bacterium]